MKSSALVETPVVAVGSALTPREIVGELEDRKSVV